MADEPKLAYPCYFPLTPDGVPELVDIDGAVCVAMFTSVKGIEAFHNAKYRTTRKTSVPTIRLDSAAELLKFLKDCQPEFDAQECFFVALDVSPAPGARLCYVRYAEVIAELGGQEAREQSP